MKRESGNLPKRRATLRREVNGVRLILKSVFIITYEEYSYTSV
ncbi:hypothetical protein [Gottschalkia acidurici]|nr:hypothetical protein [Gottschalkia acidurici]